MAALLINAGIVEMAAEKQPSQQRMRRRAAQQGDCFQMLIVVVNRVIVSKCKPNPGHYAIAALERRCKQDGKVFTLLTQNIDGLHQKAGSTATELHGSLWKTRCLTCEDVVENLDIPICPALEGKGAPDVNAKDARIPNMQLPRCKKCHGLLRPHVVWFGESLFPDIIKQAYDSLKHCDLLLVIGTSALVQPAAGFAPIVKGGGGHVAEFNVEDTPISRACSFKFQGKSGETLVRALGLEPGDLGINEATSS
ncbi:hypothetical protein L7F22_050365 [Adiantum nelumboides]|nr:hypothetical protein [Adiantum nelumboides]